MVSKVQLDQLREHWDRYATGLRVPGTEWSTLEFFLSVKQEHDRAYAYSNEIVDIPAHKGKKVLEIGCGIGIDALEFAKHGAHITFLGPSEKCIQLTRTYFNYHNLDKTSEPWDCEELGYEEDTFDVVIARGILQFAPDPERVVDEIFRVLKPGGVVYAHLHNRYSWYVLLAKLAKTNLIHEAMDPPINRLHSVREVTRLFRKFSSLSIFLDRFPSATRRPGVWARMYNNVFVPFTKLLPKSILRRFGFYIIVRAYKPDFENV